MEKTNVKIPWYLNPLVIIILFLLYPLYIPPVIGLILLILHHKRMKLITSYSDKYLNLIDTGYSESIELSELITSQKNELSSINTEMEIATTKKLKIDEAVDIHELIVEKENELSKINKSITKTNTKKEETIEMIKKLKEEYIELEEEVLMQSYGFFDPKYQLEDSEAYKVRLRELKDIQKNMVRTKDAVNFSRDWTVNGSKAEGRKMTNNLIRQALRTFNSECDIAISKVTINNIQSMEKRIRNVFDAVNRMNATNQVSIQVKYLNLKYEELYLALEYAQKLEQEKEEQRQIKEQMKEEEKVRREINALKAKVEKEEKHFIKAIDKLEEQKLTANEKELLDLESKLKELREKLSEVENQKEDVLNRERNTRAGYVYIISNIGSFGEDVYKIGVTRRLTPFDRIRELSSASVPFLFDVHAMIFSEDAPTLENTLHKTFHHKRLNLVNERKEFFKVTLDEIKDVVEKSHDKTVEFKMTALAEEFKQSEAIRSKQKLELEEQDIA